MRWDSKLKPVFFAVDWTFKIRPEPQMVVALTFWHIYVVAVNALRR
jgi:hypothetical protein